MACRLRDMMQRRKMTHMPNANLLTSPQVALLLGKSIRTVHRLVSSGDLIPAHKLPGPNGAFLFDERDVARLLTRDAA